MRNKSLFERKVNGQVELLLSPTIKLPRKNTKYRAKRVHHNKSRYHILDESFHRKTLAISYYVITLQRKDYKLKITI